MPKVNKYSFDVLTTERVFVAALSGFMTAQDGQAFLAGYLGKVKGIRPEDYCLVVDASGAGVVNQEAISGMEQTLRLFLSAGFQRVVFISPVSAIAKSQFSRVSKIINLVAEFANSRDEAIAKATCEPAERIKVA